MARFTLKDRFMSAASSRGEWEDNWQELSDYYMPYESDFDRIRVRGANRTFQLYNSTGSDAMETAAAGLFSRATNPQTKWFKFKTNDPDKNKRDDVRKHLEEVRKRVQEMISSKLSAQMYLDYRLILTFGWANMYIEEDDEDVLFGRVYPLRDIYFLEDHRGKVNTVFRKFQLTGSQVMSHFDRDDDKIPAKIITQIKKKPDAMIDFVHAVFPREKISPKSKIGKNKKFASVWFDMDSGSHIREGGFDEMPYITPRLDMIAGEVYGRGPGGRAIPEVRTLNKFDELAIDAGNMAIRPPMDVPQEAYTTPLRMTPAALNYNQDEQGKKASPINVVGDVNLAFSIIANKEAAVRKIFFNDQLQLITQGPQMTATEVLERTQQQMLMLGPWHGRLEEEFLRPLIERVFSIMQKANKLPDAPDILADAEIVIQYDSPLALAQKQADARAIDDTIAFAAETQEATGVPVLDNFKVDIMSRRRALIKGLDPDLLVDEDKRDDDREVRAEAAIAAAQAEAAKGLIEGAQGLAALPGGEEIVRDELQSLAG